MESFCSHLTAHQSLVRAGTDLSPPPAGWTFLRVCSGMGYLMHGAAHQEISPGDLVVIPADARSGLRASLLGDLRLCHFGVRPEQLAGFFTAEEQLALNPATRDGRPAARLIQRDAAAARLHANLCALRPQEPGALVRAAMLAVAVQALRDLLAQPPQTLGRAKSAEEKLADLAARVPESELLRRTAGELARECGCSERHLRRLFVKHFGTPLLHRQIAWRIEQAKQLLVETDAKIIDIASQCGFCSLGQFNTTFKRQTGMTSGKWREGFARAKIKHARKHPQICPRQANREIMS
jgi:AraC-like DNA-binding protein